MIPKPGYKSGPFEKLFNADSLGLLQTLWTVEDRITESPPGGWENGEYGLLKNIFLLLLKFRKPKDQSLDTMFYAYSCISFLVLPSFEQTLFWLVFLFLEYQPLSSAEQNKKKDLGP